MKTTTQQIRTAIESQRAHLGVTRGVPNALKPVVAEFTHHRKAQGDSEWRLAKALGIGQMTLQKLLREYPPKALVPVRVVDATREASSRSLSSPYAGIIVRSHGLTIEGLSVEDTIQLVRGLS